MKSNERGLGSSCCLAVLCGVLLCAPAAAETIVTFPDANLEAGIRTALGISAPTPITATDMLGLTSLSVPFTGITDLTGIQYATNLSKLWIGGNNISTLAPVAGLGNLTFLEMEYLSCTVDLAPLAGLFRLETLFADMNDISDITPLSGLTNLNLLDLGQNLISDITPLKDMTKLRHLILMQNRVTTVPVFNAPELREIGLQSNDIADISNLAASTFAEQALLDLRDNPLNQDAYDVYIPQILASPSGTRVVYGPIPEPGSLLMLGFGLLLGFSRRGLRKPHGFATGTQD